ncbi:MAG: POTRA domain-containing protein [Elusimicrobiota bacterium]
MSKLLLLAALLGSSAHAQESQLPGFGTPLSTETISQSSTPYQGISLPTDKGPWVISEIRFVGNQNVSEYVLQNRVRARRGVLYTPSDVAGDLQKLQGLSGVLSARANLYAQPNQPVPENYSGISISSMMARLVYTLEEKPLEMPGLSPGTTIEAAVPTTTIDTSSSARKQQAPPVSVSGVVFTPTAYRGLDRDNRLGISLDINTLYYIGRLYGKNDYSSRKTNYIDRLGVWFICVDGKMQVQTEGRWRPAVAAGAMGIFSFRDAPQPSYQSSFNVTVKPSEKSSKQMAGAYVVASKRIRKLRSSIGFMEGNAGDMPASLTEFLSEQSLRFNGHPGQIASSKSTFFASTLYMITPSYPLGVEFIKPNGMALNPYLVNFKLGRFLKLNFDLAYIKFKGGWDMLGTFNFRFTQFPRGR